MARISTYFGTTQSAVRDSSSSGSQEAKMLPETRPPTPTVRRPLMQALREPARETALEEKEDTREPLLKAVVLKLGPSLKTIQRGSSRLLTATLDFSFGSAVLVNFNAGKYFQILNNPGSLAYLTWAFIFANLNELSALQAIFVEAFVQRCSIKYIPVNKYSANSTASANAAGSPGQLNTCMGTLSFRDHNSTKYADNSTAWYQSCQGARFKVFDLGSPMEWSTPNPEKFEWDGPIGDQTTSTSTMGWINMGNSSILGGFYQLATPYLSGAAAGIGDLLENGVFGHAIYTMRLALRSRQ